MLRSQMQRRSPLPPRASTSYSTVFKANNWRSAREMGILLGADSQRLSFNLPRMTNSITFADQTLNIPASGVVSETSSENGRNLFGLELAADLSDLQENISDILLASIDRAPDCGERVNVKQATLTPDFPNALVIAQLHFERWACPLAGGRQYPTEVANSDGTIEVRLIPFINPKSGLALAADTTHVDADGFLRDLLRTGDFGLALRDEIAASILSIMQKATDLKTTLPPAAQGNATIQKAQFQDAGAGQLSLTLDGQLQLSDAQTQQFTIQLKQRQPPLRSAVP